jgi:hypothetical protein
MKAAHMSLGLQIVWLFVMALAVACVAWTVTHEEIFREPREFCADRSRNCNHIAARKFFYIFTCEYCFSHYVTLLFLAFTGYKLLDPGWFGYVIAFFAVVWVANFYMSLFGHLRLDLKSQRVEIKAQEHELESDKILK